MNITIRAATAAEAALVHAIMRAAFAQYDGSLYRPSGALRETVTDVEKAMAEGGAILAFLDGEAVGSARFARKGDYVYIGRVAVLPRYRRKGLARAMVLWLEDLARAEGFPEVRLGVRLTLPDNYRLYHGLGYRVVRLHPYPYGEEMATLAWLPEMLSDLTHELRSLEPTAIAVLLCGSLARGTAGSFSCVDLRVVTEAKPAQRDRVRLMRLPNTRVVYVAISSRSRAELLVAAAELMQTDPDARILWEVPGTTEALRHAIAAREPAPSAFAGESGHDLETLLAHVAKLKNAASTFDESSIHHHARKAAECCGRLLRPLNAPPPNYAADMRYCLGEAAEARPLSRLVARTLRLALETLQVLRVHSAPLGLPADLEEALCAGALEKYAAQEWALYTP